MKNTLVILLTTIWSVSLFADIDEEFKASPHERFALYTGDGNYKQAYHWSFNIDGGGAPITVFLNHGSGGEWYDEIENRFGPCGPDYLGVSEDFRGTEYDGLCETDQQGNRLFLADYNNYHVPVGPELETFMLRKIVGSTKFAAWYFQDAFSHYDSPVHIFMVGRYNIVKSPSHLNNTLYWLQVTDQGSTSRNTLPPYNFDGYGLSNIHGDDRPFHTAPDISAFDNMFLYKAVKEQFPEVSLENIVIEGRSNGGSAMFALAADYAIWPQHVREFWSRNLVTLPIGGPLPDPTQFLTVETVMDDPILRAAFNQMLSTVTSESLHELLGEGLELELYSSDGVNLSDDQNSSLEFGQGETVPFIPETFNEQLSELVGGDFYADVKLIHAFYPGCRLDGLMGLEESLGENEVNEFGDNNHGYQVALKFLLSFGANDSLYSYWCDDRVAQASHSQSTPLAPLVGKDSAVESSLFANARHGFDYKDAYKNLSQYTNSSQIRAQEAREAIERVINQVIKEVGLEGQYQLPENLD
ncbi:hypothetical protein [Alteromonas oceanisediminis]|uniref:hypothetical protein n=1 Tax=Alteromonas oceanisediminis TaxID=2836180 RepID=UPI001BDA5723|nr:hypothetical protein [Alteromonas oceanisediminis]MBT0587070.1 hypothetical protein [Alteromonas oceanisediminis]